MKPMEGAVTDVQTGYADGVLQIVLTRPPVNACSYSLYEGLSGALDELAQRDDVGAVVFRGEGRGFCAGADVRQFLDLTPQTRRARHDMVSGVMRKLYDAPVPVIVAIHGFAIGAGLAMASLCDIRFASPEAVFAMPEIDRGTVGGGGAFFNRLGIRSGQIREMLYTGRRYSAQEALDIGLIDHLVPLEELSDRVHQLAATIAAKSRLALRLTKQAANEAESLPGWYEGYVASHRHSAALVAGAEASEGVRAFLERRQPRYASASPTPELPV
jgi:enoyl-CoA hydratase/carnithine racemase